MEKRSSRKDGRPSVFLSHKIADANTATLLSEALQRRGIEVCTADQYVSDDDASPTIERMLENVDAVIALVSDPPSPYVDREISVAREQGLDVLLVVAGDAATTPDVADLPRFALPDPGRAFRAALAKDLARAQGDISVRLAKRPTFWLYAMAVDAELLRALADPSPADRLDDIAAQYLNYRYVGSTREFNSVYAQMDFIADVVEDQGIRERLRKLRTRIEAGRQQ